MKRNILEAIAFAVMRYIRYVLIFVVLYTLFNDIPGLKKALCFWCIPLSLGEFFGYWGSKQFVFFQKKRFVLIAILILILFNCISGYVVKKLLFQEELWLLRQIELTVPMCFGYVFAIKDCLKNNIQPEE